MDESFYSTKGGRRKGQSRKSGGRGKATRGRGGAPNKRPRPASLSSPRGGSGVESDGSQGSGGGDNGDASAKKAKRMVPGEGKARALAAVQRFVATLPPVEYGRDEGGGVATKDEAREARSKSGSGGGGGGGGRGSGGATTGGGASKRDRAAASEKGDGQSREKKAKKLKSSREERRREETDSKQRISQVRKPAHHPELPFRAAARMPRASEREDLPQLLE